LYDNLGDCIKESSKKSLQLFTPVLVLIFEAYLLSYTVSYRLERAVLVLLINFCLANVTLHLMLTNMTKKPYKLVQLAYVYPLVILVAHWAGAADWFVLGLDKLMCVSALANFVIDIYVLSKQFLAHTGRTFFIR
jgi:hypothetical protein